MYVSSSYTIDARVELWSKSYEIVYDDYSLLCGFNQDGVIYTRRVPEHRSQWWLDSIEWNNDRQHSSGQGVKIAILDTGVETSHADMSKR